ncbi:hypothetical protein O7598_12545 [Micromonospora sp. WMMC241]|uniref:hypothetical protein n=1 Tax=Micromonospora sp. WMMC241 TaxID=3015159 RepID=UPI0022B7127D|nr:hypothetical protein [Micromonospora sp. WMMC241]MCZ7437228.1 hypothetical protein [Micromonospora sp. WMMC241]
MSTTTSLSLIRRVALLVGVVLAGVLVLAAPASARPGGPPGRDHAFTLPTAPAAARQVRLQAVAPTVSPAARQVRHVAAGKPATCASGNLCTFVWDPTTASWKIFDLFTCARYSLANWHGAGFYVNSQTGGPTVTFYGQTGNVVNSFTGTGTGSQNWDPVWSIRNCT